MSHDINNYMNFYFIKFIILKLITCSAITIKIFKIILLKLWEVECFTCVHQVTVIKLQKQVIYDNIFLALQ
jgi:hypothetical protein